MRQIKTNVIFIRRISNVYETNKYFWHKLRRSVFVRQIKTNVIFTRQINTSETNKNELNVYKTN